MKPGDLVRYDSKKFRGEHPPGIIIDVLLGMNDCEMAKILWCNGRIFNVYFSALEVISEAQ